MTNQIPLTQGRLALMYGNVDAPGIYAIRCIADGKNTTYIGQATNIRKRFRYHIQGLIRGSHHNHYLQHAWDKYGMHGFDFIVFENTTKDKAILTEREQFWLDETRKEYPIYNHSTSAFASRLGVKHTQETIDKMRRTAKGRKPSLATRLGISRSNKTRPHRATPYPELINVFTGERVPAGTNCATFSREHNIYNTTFRQMLRGKLSHAYGWTPLAQYSPSQHYVAHPRTAHKCT